jgi:hypothetical protein
MSRVAVAGPCASLPAAAFVPALLKNGGTRTVVIEVPWYLEPDAAAEPVSPAPEPAAEARVPAEEELTGRGR